ncbi:hypothetical protein HanRHA438_Chr08g0347421 [Helianthus annuus]|nr:hypothetical protein HanRHA438_Chr08g0347421 [Helianthus annuus]
MNTLKKQPSKPNAKCQTQKTKKKKKKNRPTIKKQLEKDQRKNRLEQTIEWIKRITRKSIYLEPNCRILISDPSI